MVLSATGVAAAHAVCELSLRCGFARDEGVARRFHICVFPCFLRIVDSQRHGKHMAWRHRLPVSSFCATVAPTGRHHPPRPRLKTAVTRSRLWVMPPLSLPPRRRRPSVPPCPPRRPHPLTLASVRRVRFCCSPPAAFPPETHHARLPPCRRRLVAGWR